jgi:hypothetical protein
MVKRRTDSRAATPTVRVWWPEPLSTRIIKRLSTAFLRAVRGAWRGIIKGRIRL